MRRFTLGAFILTLLLNILPVGGSETFRSYSLHNDSTYIAFGRYPYESDGTEKPIIWRLLQLEGGTAYLLSHSILEVSRLHSIAQGYPGWGEADLNSWLQGSFKEKAFNQEEAAALVQTQLGWVSLPSSDDLKNKAFGFDSDMSRRALGTPWADSRGLYFYRHKNHSPYWTRTPSDKKFAHRTIKLEGNIGYLGVTADDMGVRPVIWIDTEMVQIDVGNGTLNDPFLVVPIE